MYHVSYGLDPKGQNELLMSINFSETASQLDIMKKDVQ